MFISAGKLLLCLFVGLVGLACGAAITAQAEITPVKPYRFATDEATVRMTVTSPYYQQIWRQALTNWNHEHVFQFRLTTAAQAQITIAPMPLNERKASIAGLTYVTYNNDDLITKVDTYLNSTTLKTYKYTHQQRIDVAEHELGHTMGLAHNPQMKSVMYFANRYYSIQKVDEEAVNLDYRAQFPRSVTDTKSAETYAQDGVQQRPLFNQLNKLVKRDRETTAISWRKN
ncbi:matrixin family metalloprotease [Secundilactobacillus folii]|uniref:Matrixin family metalloprotease n=1 Tax=Secundilactobacillus folii TaxID=2678357 RepID=A0A7X2XUD0_9LACO|nr:matrixin family metalloprotease [Secundilactobacillus folii]MTV81744.1 matrixin family metalloprotease [Secundilactobacillus folii]